ncbi:type VII secretion-associated serine protease mycosin [Streptacidiphilus griseoplanus]|uniref:type VII secretion-associated serine protease mycosin n=1 Tax=Peterkaempfera griseoplana TaxID=66896 RepID=UPI001FE1DA36|nr:type VII secretion-associated serine protease mycosin [Peterkaempfera griseoplana]
MKAPQMWQTSTGKGVTVAVIDSGVEADHPDLAGQVLPGKNFSGLAGGATTDVDGHGTGMADLIAGTGKGQGGQGAYGLAPGAKILPIRLNTGASGANEEEHGAEYRHQLSEALRYAADSNSQIISISQATPDSDSELASAVSYAVGKGKLVVAGVGNSGATGNPVFYPAALPGVVGVAAIDRNGQATAESEHGPQVDLAAPGADIARACTGQSGYCKTHGTSDATALVSGSAALVWAKHPDWTANQVLRVLVNTAGKDGSGRSDFLGYGVVRPRIALTTPGDPGPADVDPLAASGKPADPGTSAPAASPSDGGASSAPGDAAKPSSSAAPAPATASDDGGSGAGMWIGIGAAVLVVVAIVAVVLARRGRGGSGGGGGNPPSGGYGGGQYGGQYGNQYSAPQPPYQAPPAGGGFGPPQQ